MFLKGLKSLPFAMLCSVGLLGTTVALTQGCEDNDNGFEDLGEEIDEGIDEAGDELDDAGDEIDDELDDMDDDLDNDDDLLDDDGIDG